MESIFFGNSSAPLYGVLHEPEGTTIRDFATLLCYPFGQEYMITHRALRTLCKNMTRAGVPCMRFDYAGSGDSAGDRFGIDTAVENTRLAAGELAEFSGMDNIKVVGLRLGAAIAVLASQQSEFIQQVTLWDPVIDGSEYLREVTGHESAVTTRTGTTWVNGYPLDADVLQQINSLHIQAVDFDRLDFAHFILSQPNNSTAQLIQALQNRDMNLKVDRSDLDDINTWIRADYQGAFLLPHKILKRIQDGLLQDR